jgi:hypothetical protein
MKIARAGNRKSRLNDVHTHLLEVACDLDLFRERQRGPGRLFAIA